MHWGVYYLVTKNRELRRRVIKKRGRLWREFLYHNFYKLPSPFFPCRTLGRWEFKLIVNSFLKHLESTLIPFSNIVFCCCLFFLQINFSLDDDDFALSVVEMFNSSVSLVVESKCSFSIFCLCQFVNQTGKLFGFYKCNNEFCM